jgi:iron(III) transport system permease protein
MTIAVSPPAAAAPPVRRKLSRDDWTLGAGLLFLALWLVLAVAAPLVNLLSKSFRDRDGAWVGLANYVEYFSTPALAQSIWNSLWVSLLVAAIVIPLAFVYAYALTRSCMPAKGLFRVLALAPVLAPSLLPAISFVYLFGNQGLLKSWMGGASIYGPIGIVMSEVFYCFPHALLIIVTALGLADARLYEAATALRATRFRIFFTVTLPGVRYGLISALFVVLTLVITDFGAPKVIGGQFNVLATDVYKQVIGQQNFAMGAVVGMVLLAPAALSFVVDRMVARRQTAMLSARAVPLEPQPARGFDAIMLLVCLVVGAMILTVFAVSVWASFIAYWPYNMSLTLRHYDFGNADAAGWSSYWNSLRLSFWAALFGTIVIFCGAYVIEKTRAFPFLRGAAQLLAMTPLAVPGLVLGLAYIFFFNALWNPLNFLYGTMAILVLNTMAHFYTVSHLTAVTALKQIDSEFEAVAASLKAPVWRLFLTVTAPICLPAIVDIFIYLFLNAMTTVSAVIFLYATDTKPASVALVNIEDSGNTAAAAAMATVIAASSAVLRATQVMFSRWLDRRLQAWRRR